MKIRGLLLAVVSVGVLAGAFVGATPKALAAEKPAVTTVSIVLKPQNQSVLDSYATQTVDPHSDNFHHYLTPLEVAEKFGQSGDQIDEFVRYFDRYHVSTTAYQGNLVLKLRGSRANLVRAFKATKGKAAGRSITRYKLPGNLAAKVVTVIGLYAKNPSSDSGSQSISAYPKFSREPNLKLSADKFSKKYGALKFANCYQLSQLYDRQLTGKDQRVGIITTNTDVRTSDVQTYWRQLGINTDASRLNKVYVNDGAKKTTRMISFGLTGNQVEATLDVEQAGSVAPDATVDLYLATSANDSVQSNTLYFNAFTQAISSNHDKQISTSFSPGVELAKNWFSGSSETLADYNQAMNIVLAQAATQGISVFSSSGDYGPWMRPMKKQNLAVTTSPFMTIVGGTTLPFKQKINGKNIWVKHERAWGDTTTLSAAELKKGIFSGSGGGFSRVNSTPDYQLGVPGVNTYNAIQLLTYRKGKFILNRTPKLVSGTASGRNVPDIVGNADPYTGYATYVSGDNVKVNKKGKITRKPTKIWMVNGGTSYTTPQMAAATAVMNSGLKASVGFWNPQIYRFAVTEDSPFTPLNSKINNNNLYYTGQPGKVYNQATGLGTVNFEKLTNQFTNEDQK